MLSIAQLFLQRIKSNCGTFLWQKSSSKRGIHWCTWSELCQLKNDGGMGFRDFGKFNIALLAKQGWRILSNPGSLVARLLRAKYFPTSTFLQASLGSSLF
ncbi:hypothetical protein GQ457_09G025950 [Hibiscus cannabinus]